MPFLLTMSRAIDALNTRIGAVCDYLVLLAVLISAGNAASRYAFSLSSNAFLEIQWQLFAAIVLLGASVTLKKNEHVRVDILYSWVSPATRLWIDLVGIILFMLPVLVLLFWLSVPFFADSFRLDEHSANPGGLPFWPVKFMLPLGFAQLFLQALSELIKRIAAVRGVITLETAYEKPLQ